MQTPRIALASTLTAILLLGSISEGAPMASIPRVGDTYQITLTRHSTEQGSDGSSGSSDDRDTVIERVIGLRSDGLELEYDFPKDTPKDERDTSWQFPARVFRPFHGPAQLLDRAAVERRIDAWLKAAKWPRSICGHWIFTWNAFQIDCDPDSVVKAVQAFELDADVGDGVRYEDSDAREPGVLAKRRIGQATQFVAEMAIDPEAVRRAQAHSDVAIGEITNKPVSLDVALNNHSMDGISGTISVTFDTDAQGNVWRRTKITQLQTKGPDGKTNSKMVTEILERRQLPHN